MPLLEGLGQAWVGFSVGRVVGRNGALQPPHGPWASPASLCLQAPFAFLLLKRSQKPQQKNVCACWYMQTGFFHGQSCKQRRDQGVLALWAARRSSYHRVNAFPTTVIPRGVAPRC